MVPDGWKASALADFCSKPISYGIVQTGEDVPDGVPCLRVVDLTKRVMNPREMIKTTREISDSYKKTILEEGEIVMALRGEVGVCKIIDPSLVQANITRGLARISAKKEIVSSNYLVWELRSPRFRSDLIRRVGGSALQEISLGELRMVETLIPPLPEQKKIAEILSTWDDAIVANEDLLANSRLRKKALMQQLLTGKKRLPGYNGEWRSLRIVEFCKKESIRAGVDDSYPVLSCTKHGGFVDSLDYFNKQVFSDDTSNYKVIKRNWIGFPSNHVEEGSIGIQNLYEAGIVSPIYEVFSVDISKCLPDYLYANLKSDMYRQIFASRTNASVDRRGSLRWGVFSEIDVLLPPVDEQKLIVDVIDTSAKEIEALELRINNLKLQKKALMQQLLTGKKRVKVDLEPVTA